MCHETLPGVGRTRTERCPDGPGQKRRGSPGASATGSSTGGSEPQRGLNPAVPGARGPRGSPGSASAGPGRAAGLSRLPDGGRASSPPSSGGAAGPTTPPPPPAGTPPGPSPRPHSAMAAPDPPPRAGPRRSPPPRNVRRLRPLPPARGPGPCGAGGWLPRPRVVPAPPRACRAGLGWFPYRARPRPRRRPPGAPRRERAGPGNEAGSRGGGEEGNGASLPPQPAGRAAGPRRPAGLQLPPRCRGRTGGGRCPRPGGAGWRSGAAPRRGPRDRRYRQRWARLRGGKKKKKKGSKGV